VKAGLRLITADEYLDEVQRQEEGDYSQPIPMWVRSKGVDFSDYKQNTRSPSERKASALGSKEWDTGCSEITLTSSASIYSTPLPKDRVDTEAELAHESSNRLRFISGTLGKESATEGSASAHSDLLGRDRPPGLSNTPPREYIVNTANTLWSNESDAKAISRDSDWGGMAYTINTTASTAADTATCATQEAVHLNRSGMITNMSSPQQVPYTTDSEEMGLGFCLSYENGHKA